MTPKNAEVALYWVADGGCKHETEPRKCLHEISRYHSWGAAMLDKDWIVRNGEAKPEELALAWVAKK